MTIAKVRLLLFSTIVIMAFGPLAGSFYYLNNVIDTALGLGFNQQIPQVLSASAGRLRELRQYAPEQAEIYRTEFDNIERLRQVYSNSELVRENVVGSLNIYFALGVAGALVLSILLAVIISKRIDASYHLMFNGLRLQENKLLYLERIASWQGLAKMLAHEIKNPLTPIEVLASSLPNVFRQRSVEEFEQYLEETEKMIGEEIGHLKNIVDSFSEFAKVPKVTLEKVKITVFSQTLMNGLSNHFPNVTTKINLAHGLESNHLCIDNTLLRQAFFNIIQNGIEANPDNQVSFVIQFEKQQDRALIEISNNGKAIDQILAVQIFEPHISTKSQKSNMGLGLTVVKKIILEHGGEVRYETKANKPTFIISLGLVN